MTLDDAQGWAFLIAAATTAVVTILNLIRSTSNTDKLVRVSEKTDILAEKTDQLKEKADVIHDLTNNSFSMQRQKISDLEALVMTLKGSAIIAEQTRVVLADETVKAVIAVQTAPNIVTPVIP